MTGLIRPSLLLASALAAGAPALAGDAGDSDQPVDEAFLMFLGEWEDGQGNWQDPLEYADPRWAGLDEEQVNDDEN